MRLSKKIGIGFGIMVLASCAAVSVNWLSIRGIKKMSLINDQISKSYECLLEIRRQEKNFILRGFKKYGTDTKNAFEKWQALVEDLIARLEGLRANPDLDRREVDFVGQALTSFREYATAFQDIVDVRKRQDEALPRWMTIPSELFAGTRDTVARVIDPLTARARLNGNIQALSDLTQIEKSLHEKVIQPFLLLRAGADSAVAHNIKEGKEPKSPVIDIRKSLTQWQQQVTSYPELAGIAGMIAGHIEQWEVAERGYVDAMEAQNQANTLMVAAARELGKILNDKSDAINTRMFQVMNRSVLIGLVTAAGSTILGILIAVLTAHHITRSINEASSMLANIAQGDGDLTRRLEIATKDEIGEMAGWFNLFIEKLQKMIGEIASESKFVESAISELSAISGQMNQGSRDVSDNSNSVATAAEQMSGNMNSVAAAMEQTATNINTVSDAVEKMSATIEEIARSGSRTSAVTNQAVQEAGQAAAKVQQLGQAAEKIGKVTETITDISEQTNLLSLNATIEAARAGEAGKGFAVVASEIKELARQTTAATEEIRSKIEGIQHSTVETVDEIERITKVIHEANELINSIAVAVEEQSRVVRDIADSVIQASAGLSEVNQNVAYTNTTAGEVAQNLSDLSRTASDMAHSSHHINESITHLTQLTGKLDYLVGQFNI